MVELFMDITDYQTLTGITVPTDSVAKVTANIARTQSIIENMLGFTLDETKVDINQYVELGKTTSDCPCTCDIDITSLDAPDAVVGAYRLFPYNKNDKYLSIDPAVEIHAIKLVVNDVTIRTLVEFEDYRIDVQNGLIRFIEVIECWCSDLKYCNHVQLAVDADWAWLDKDDIPLDLQYVWTDMVTFYSNPQNNIKSETLGPHSYTKFENIKPENKSENLLIIKKYSGPNGIVNKIITV